MSSLATVPAADLASCDREPIHIPGSIQPHGFLLACRMGDFAITHVSANTPGLVGIAPQQQLCGADIRSVLGDATAAALDKSLDQVLQATGLAGRTFGVRIAGSELLWDAAVHEYDGMRIYELEPAGGEAGGVEPLHLVRTILNQLQQAKTLRDLCDQAVRLIRDLIGYDRVMVYRFLDGGAGQVIAEAKHESLEPLLNLRYPASDIPAQARELYKRNSIRLIADVGATPSPISSDGGKTLDLSYSSLRAVSPIHIEYLRNMKVGASLSISIIVGGELWGLIACHHTTPKHVPSNVRAAAELLGQVFSLQIQTVEGIEAYVVMRASRALLDRIVAEFPIEGDLIDNLAQRLEPLSAFINSDGVGLWMDGLWRTVGVAPSMTEVSGLAAFMAAQVHGEVYATENLGDVYPPSKDWPCGICGLLAVPLSQSSTDYLFFFRKEVAQTIDWGGNPDKPVITSGDKQRISPRKSFDAWREDVRGQSLAWTSRERLIGDTLRVYLLDIIVRFSDVILDERRKSQERTRLLAGELNSRVKGTLELIQSLVARGHEEKSLTSFVRSLEGRIGAIALAHCAVAAGEGPQVRQLVEAAVGSNVPLAEQFEAAGPDVELDAKAYTVLALVIHELASNAARFGALAVPQGHVRVNWHRDATGRLVLIWEETGGLPVRTATREGLGLNIIRRNIPHSLGGEANLEFHRTGLVAEFVVPARYVVVRSGIESPAQFAALPGAVHRPLEGVKVLVLEDQMLAAMDLQEGLERSGASLVAIAGTVEGALNAIAEHRPDGAVLDVDLDDATSFPVADELDALDIPFVFLASEAERRQIPKRFEDVLVVPKPYTAGRVAELLREALMPNLIRAVLNKLV
jgi:light-regulated signal transduction histidine kinase (bacteriophytochrome)/CheY-like chemotaxis protein